MAVGAGADRGSGVSVGVVSARAADDLPGGIVAQRQRDVVAVAEGMRQRRQPRGGVVAVAGDDAIAAREAGAAAEIVIAEQIARGAGKVRRQRLHPLAWP